MFPHGSSEAIVKKHEKNTESFSKQIAFVLISYLPATVSLDPYSADPFDA